MSSCVHRSYDYKVTNLALCVRVLLKLNFFNEVNLFLRDINVCVIIRCKSSHRGVYFDP